jgi:hypothetical protein
MDQLNDVLALCEIVAEAEVIKAQPTSEEAE